MQEPRIAAPHKYRWEFPDPYHSLLEKAGNDNSTTTCSNNATSGAVEKSTGNRSIFSDAAHEILLFHIYISRIRGFIT